jgi:hypothetical protein
MKKNNSFTILLIPLLIYNYLEYLFIYLSGGFVKIYQTVCPMRSEVLPDKLKIYRRYPAVRRLSPSLGIHWLLNILRSLCQTVIRLGVLRYIIKNRWPLLILRERSQRSFMVKLDVGIYCPIYWKPFSWETSNLVHRYILRRRWSLLIWLIHVGHADVICSLLLIRYFNASVWRIFNFVPWMA